MARCASPSRGEAAAGFTILEVLVALAILGMVLGSVMGLLSTGTVGLARADGATRAVMVAQSVLAALGTTVDPQDDGLSDVSDDGYAWRIEIRPYSDETTPPSKPAAVQLYRVAVIVERGRGLAYRLVTLALGPAPGKP